MQKVSFIPRIPQANVKSNNIYTSFGDFFVISEKKHDLVSFKILESKIAPGRICHISKVFSVSLSEQDDSNFRKLYSECCDFTYHKLSQTTIAEHRIVIIPVMQKKGLNEWDATIDWCRSYFSSQTIFSIFNALCIRHDKSNQGRKLREFFRSNGEKINRFVRFVMSLDVPVHQFVQEAPELRNEELSKQELMGLWAAMKLQERIIGRAVRYERVNKARPNPTRDAHIDVVYSVAFDCFAPLVHRKEETYHEYFQHVYNQDVDGTIPLIDVFPVRMRGADEWYNMLSEFPDAFCKEHKRILEVMQERNDVIMKLITSIWNRIPDDYATVQPTRLQPMELAHSTDFPLISGTFIHLLNRLDDQLKPVSIGKQLASGLIRSAAEMIYKETGYKFKNLMYLRSALTDPTYQYNQTLLVHPYQRLEFLGDAVLDLCTTIPIFNYNEDAPEGDMTILRHTMVSNKTFAKLGKRMGIDKYVLTLAPSNYTDSSKSMADIVESLFGAIFMDSNMRECFRVYQVLVRKYQHIFMKAVSRLKCGANTIEGIVSMSPEDYGVIRCSNIRNFPHRLTVEHVRDFIGFDINYLELPLFKVALSHVSALKEFTYDRMEFIGDNVLKLAVCTSLYTAFPETEESGLGICGSYYKSNDEVGKAAIALGLAKLAEFGVEKESLAMDTLETISYEGAYVDKAHGDLFEAVTAAVAMTQGLDTALKFVRDNVIGERFRNRADAPQYDPKSTLILRISKELHCSPVYDIWLSEGMHYAYVSVCGVQLPFIGTSEDKLKSAMVVSTKILDEMDRDPEFIAKIVKEAELIRDDQNQVNI